MQIRRAAVAAWVLACAVAWPAAARDPQAGPPALTLDAALTRIDRLHPELRLFDARGAVLAAERDQAAQRPPLVAGLELENAFGTGDARALDAAELTLSLASVLERGGKLDARRSLAQARIDALAIERETRRLDLLAEAARRYLGAVAARAQRALAQADIEQRRRAVAAARLRLQAGASPESVLLTTQAALARAELALARADQQAQVARQHLAALWGERAPQFAVAAADPLRLPAIADAAALADLLQRSPELAQFADAQRIGEARLQLARSAEAVDLDWQLGLRRAQDSGDTALVAGLSLALALGSRARAQPGIRAAQAELDVLNVEREARGMALYATLVEAHGRYQLARLEVARLRDEVLPTLARAEAAAERAYRAGAASYLEWAQLQSERTASRRQQLEVALDAQRALIELQRLTGQPLLAAPITRQGHAE